MADHSGLMSLAQNDVMNIRMEGLILSVLVQKGLLTNQEARGLIRDVIANQPSEASIGPAYHALLAEFP